MFRPTWIKIGGAWQLKMSKKLPNFVARYNWPHSFSCLARCCKRQISCHNKRYIQSRPRTGEVQTRHEYWNCTLLCCDYLYSMLWEALHANKVEIGARCSDYTQSCILWFTHCAYKSKYATLPITLTADARSLQNLSPWNSKSVWIMPTVLTCAVITLCEH